MCPPRRASPTRCSRPTRCARSSARAPTCRGCSTSRRRSRAPQARAGVDPGVGRAGHRARNAAPSCSTWTTLARATAAAGNPAIPLVKALTALVADRRRGGRALRALGRDQPGRDGHRASCCSCAPRSISSTPTSRTAVGRAGRAGEAHIAHAAGRPDLAAAGAPGDARPQGGGLARRGRAPPRAAGRAACARRGRAVRRRGGHAGVAWRRRGSKSPPRSRGELGLALPDAALAHAARPHRARWRPRSGCSSARSARWRATCRCSCRPRSAKCFEPACAGPRRLLDDAAQAQSGRRCGGAGRRRARAAPGGDDAGGDGAGARARPGRLACRVGDAARNLRARGGRAGAHDRDDRGARSRRRADGERTSRSRAASSSPKPCRWRSAPQHRPAARRTSWSSARAEARGRRGPARCAPSWPPTPRVRAHLTPADLERLLDPIHYHRRRRRLHRPGAGGAQPRPHLILPARRHRTCRHLIDAGGVRLHYRFDGARRRARARAVQFARHRPDDVGPAGRRTCQALPRAALRHARPRRTPTRRRAPTRSSGSGATCSALLDALAIERAHFCGLSMGGMIGHVAGRPRAGPRRAGWCSPTPRPIGTADVWNARIETVREGGMAADRPAR